MSEISVIIPLYNKGKYIVRALDSVLAQTYQDFEVVVVDDGSTDNGSALVAEYEDPRVRILYQANAGPGAARNYGVRNSRSPYLSFIDADDEWLADFLRLSIEAIETHPQCSLSVTSRYEGPLREDITPRFIGWGHHTGEWFLNEYSDLAELERVRNMFLTSAIMCRRHTFERFGGFYDRMQTVCGEDTYLWLQLLFNCGVFRILQPLVWYHSDASELGHRQFDAGVLQPYFSDPALIRKNCPNEHRPLLERFLCKCAFRRAVELCERQDVATAAYLCHAFPMMRRSVWKYAKLRMKISFPKLYQAFRHAKAGVRAGASKKTVKRSTYYK